MMQYAGRVLAIKDHPIRETLVNFYPFQFYLDQRKPLPIIAKIFYELKSRNTQPGTIMSTININSKLNTLELPVYSTMQHCKKELLSNARWRSAFKELEESTKSKCHIYTDGSLAMGTAGSAVSSSNFELQARLPQGTSIYTSEL